MASIVTTAGSRAWVPHQFSKLLDLVLGLAGAVQQLPGADLASQVLPIGELLGVSQAHVLSRPLPPLRPLKTSYHCHAGARAPGQAASAPAASPPSPPPQFRPSQQSDAGQAHRSGVSGTVVSAPTAQSQSKSESDSLITGY